MLVSGVMYPSFTAIRYSCCLTGSSHIRLDSKTVLSVHLNCAISRYKIWNKSQSDSNSGALALKAHAAEHRGKKNLAIFASKKFGCEKIVRPGLRPPPHIRG